MFIYVHCLQKVWPRCRVGLLHLKWSKFFSTLFYFNLALSCGTETSYFRFLLHCLVRHWQIFYLKYTLTQFLSSLTSPLLPSSNYNSWYQKPRIEGALNQQPCVLLCLITVLIKLTFKPFCSLAWSLNSNLGEIFSTLEICSSCPILGLLSFLIK